MASPPRRPEPLEVPESLEDLNLRIHNLELRVVRRDMEFHQHWSSLKQRGKAALAPSRLLLPLVGTGAGWLFWKIFKRRAPARRHPFKRSAQAQHAHRQHQAQHGEGRGGDDKGLQLLQVLTIAWGLVPIGIRGRFGPETTQLLLGLAAGLLHGRKQKREMQRQQQQQQGRYRR